MWKSEYPARKRENEDRISYLIDVEIVSMRSTNHDLPTILVLDALPLFKFLCASGLVQISSEKLNNVHHP